MIYAIIGGYLLCVFVANVLFRTVSYKWFGAGDEYLSILSLVFSWLGPVTLILAIFVAIAEGIDRLSILIAKRILSAFGINR